MVDISFTIILQWINFAILLFLLTKLLYKPMTDFLDKRKKDIKETYDQAQMAREESDRILGEYQKKMDRSGQEARKIIFEARREGMKEKEKLIDRADDDADKILNRASEEIKLQENRVRKKLREEAVDLSIDIASKLLEKEIDEVDQRRFAEKYVKEMSEGHG